MSRVAAIYPTPDFDQKSRSVTSAEHLLGLVLRWLFAGALACVCGCNAKQSQHTGDGSMTTVDLSREKIIQITDFCGNCHPLPAPSSFPKDKWPEEVESGFGFYFESGRSDLEVPLIVDTITYFQSQAPESIDLPDAEELPTGPTTVDFVPSPLLLSGDSKSLTADIAWDEATSSLFFSDMANSKLRRWDLAMDPEFKQAASDELRVLPAECVIAEGNHLCRINLCDWNQDGLRDYMVAEIGSMIISDQKLGSVAVYLGQADGTLQRNVLAENLARPAEAVACDFDDDGDLDVLIAEFGYNQAGCFSMLRNQAVDSQTASLSPQDFEYEVLDPRHGYLAVELHDMDGDSKLDIITAIGQEFEQTVIWYNLGQGEYRRQLITAMPGPSYNTSSVVVRDIDQDGRPDIVHTCGDIFDSFVPKPFHGVRWLRNQGEYRWEVRELGMLIGAMHTAVEDFDLDGDLDIAAVGLFPRSNREKDGVSLDSVVWWEQQADLKFVRHSIERDRSLHSSCAAQDLDGDGRPELIVGEWASENSPASLRIYWNRELAENAR